MPIDTLVLAAFVVLSVATSTEAQEADDTLAGPELATDYELVMQEAAWVGVRAT